MNYTGERLIPKSGLGNIEEHLRFYNKSLEFVENKEVLDIACGSGWGTILLSNKAKKVIGLDISPEAVRYAKKEYSGNNFEFQVGSILDIPFNDGTFDIVNSIETFEHVERKHIEKLISECLRVLKKEGLFLFSTPEGEFFQYHPESPKEYQGWHFWHYTQKELEELLTPHFSNVTFLKVYHTHFLICKK